jgi:hypothetical protein
MKADQLPRGIISRDNDRRSVRDKGRRAGWPARMPAWLPWIVAVGALAVGFAVGVTTVSGLSGPAAVSGPPAVSGPSASRMPGGWL